MESSPPTTASEPQQAASPPTDQAPPPPTQRKWTKKSCHASRDLYYNCYHAEGGSEEKCRDQYDAMFAECPLSWAKFFKGKAKTQRHVEKMESFSGQMNRSLNSPLGDGPVKSEDG